MKGAISGVGSVSGLNKERISGIRGYTKKEQKEILNKFEDEAKHQEEIQAILRKNPTPPGVTFSELLEMTINQQNEDDDGVIVDIRNNYRNQPEK